MFPATHAGCYVAREAAVAGFHDEDLVLGAEMYQRMVWHTPMFEDLVAANFWVLDTQDGIVYLRSTPGRDIDFYVPYIMCLYVARKYNTQVYESLYHAEKLCYSVLGRVPSVQEINRAEVFVLKKLDWRIAPPGSVANAWNEQPREQEKHRYFDFDFERTDSFQDKRTCLPCGVC